MQSILAGAVVTLFLFALYVPWFTNKAMLAAILGSLLVNLFLMAGTLNILPDNVSLLFLRSLACAICKQHKVSPCIPVLLIEAEGCACSSCNCALLYHATVIALLNNSLSDQ